MNVSFEGMALGDTSLIEWLSSMHKVLVPSLSTQRIERREGGRDGGRKGGREKKRKLTYIVIEYKDRQEAIGMIHRKLQGGVSCDWLRCKLHR